MRSRPKSKVRQNKGWLVGLVEERGKGEGLGGTDQQKQEKEEGKKEKGKIINNLLKSDRRIKVKSIRTTTSFLWALQCN
jgi:hypothetical protein